MQEAPISVDETDQPFDEIVLQQGELISDRLNMLRIEQYPPDAQKSLRQFSLAEVAYFLGVIPTAFNIDRYGPIFAFRLM